jgi:Zn-dependent protease with chaperone function
MISALQKIEKDSTIESIKKHTVATMCIESPFAKKGKSSRRRKLRMTHPSVSERIEALKQY